MHKAEPNILTSCKKLYSLINRPLIFWDTEFNNSQEPVINLVCASLQIFDGYNVYPVLEYWLHNNPYAKDQLAKYLTSFVTQHKGVLVTYGAIAEGRALLALGLNPSDFPTVDLYSEWRQLTHNNESCQYGTYFAGNGYKKYSTPPHFDSKRNVGKDNKEVGYSLVACVGQLFGVYIDSVRKTEMRNLILRNKPTYSQTERGDIMAYCSSDVQYLPAIWDEQITRLSKCLKIGAEDIVKIQIKRGEYTAALAKQESIGIPLKMEWVRNLRKNYQIAHDRIIENLVTNHYHFYVKQKVFGSAFAFKWVAKYEAFEKFIESRGLLDTWPRTLDAKTGAVTDTLSRDDKTLQKYSHIPEIKALKDCTKNLTQIRWFRETEDGDDGDLFDSIGTDGRIRCFFGPFGTQTGRNAPPAKRFILAMSSWLRCLIDAPEGYCIISKDYESQEFAIAAIRSKDPEMITAYKSGDPYLYFAKKAKAIPEYAEPKLCKNPDLAPEDKKAEYLTYKDQRNLFKATCLGLQFGMGGEKLALKLSSDMGRNIDRSTADKLIDMHRSLFRAYWSGLKTIEREYGRRGVLILWDGWALLGDNYNKLSVLNFPVQGTGGVILREVATNAHGREIPFMCLLHDGTYALCRIEDKEAVSAKMDVCMELAVKTVLGSDAEIRVETEVHESGHVWIEGKGRKHYQLLSEFLQPMSGKEDRSKKILSTIFN